MIKTLFASLALALPASVLATTIQFQTVLGDIEVNLYDETTPETVENFLGYVNSGDYADTLFHRSVSGFVLQGGGFQYDAEQSVVRSIPQQAAVTNEPVYANVRGTIAMAKRGGDPDSATNQWFFNLSDNTGNLDAQNGGFTAFGQVTAGMDVVDAIAALNRYNASALNGAFTELPLRDWDTNSETPPSEEHYVLITNIVVLDAAKDTAKDLNPKLTTYSPSSSGGSLNGLGLLGLLVLFGNALLRRQRS